MHEDRSLIIAFPPSWHIKSSPWTRSRNGLDRNREILRHSCQQGGTEMVNLSWLPTLVTSSGFHTRTWDSGSRLRWNEPHMIHMLRNPRWTWNISWKVRRTEDTTTMKSLFAMHPTRIVWYPWLLTIYHWWRGWGHKANGRLYYPIKGHS